MVSREERGEESPASHSVRDTWLVQSLWERGSAKGKGTRESL